MTYVQHYHTRPTIVKRGEKRACLYMGVELEVDGLPRDSWRQVYRERTAEKMANIADDAVWFNTDGSLHHEGFEIISQPCSLKYHTDTLPWKRIMDIAVADGYHSHDTLTCGLHVHVNRDFFGDTTDAQDLQIAKVLILVDRLWDKLVKFSRRNPSGLNHWAKKPNCDIRPGDSRAVTVSKSKRHSYDRYTAVNLRNTDTIEFRFFRGTLKHDTFRHPAHGQSALLVRPRASPGRSAEHHVGRLQTLHQHRQTCLLCRSPHPRTRCCAPVTQPLAPA